MPTSVRGTTERVRPAPNRGFTLIEILVVLLLVGIVLGMVVVQLMPDDRSQLREESEQLALLLENAGLEARSSGVSLAWLPDKDGYRFWRRNKEGNWKAVDNGPFRFRAWRNQTHITAITIDGEPLQFGERMMLSASSFPLPFEIRLEHGTAHAIVKGSSTGTVTTEMEDQAHAVPAS